MNRIRELRQAAGMSQAEVGEILGCHGTAVSKLELETRQLDPQAIHALCDMFNCSADYLLCRSDTPHPRIPDDAVRLWNAYKAAEPNIQASIRLQLNLVNAESKIDTAAS